MVYCGLDLDLSSSRDVTDLLTVVENRANIVKYVTTVNIQLSLGFN